MTEQRPLPYWVLWDALFNLISVQGSTLTNFCQFKLYSLPILKRKGVLGDWMALSRLEFNLGWGGLESISGRWLSFGQFEMNRMSSA